MVRNATWAGASMSAIWPSTPLRMARPVGRVTRLLKSGCERRSTGVERKRVRVAGAGRTGSGVLRGHLLHLVPRHDPADDVHPLRDLAEHGVHAVQVARVGLVQHDEELAPAGVLPRVRHAERARLVAVGIAGGLALDLPPRPA